VPATAEDEERPRRPGSFHRRASVLRRYGRRHHSPEAGREGFE
jgi:hypothetical protein